MEKDLVEIYKEKIKIVGHKLKYFMRITGRQEDTTKMFLKRFNYKRVLEKNKNTNRYESVYYMSVEQLNEFKEFIRKLKERSKGKNRWY